MDAFERQKRKEAEEIARNAPPKEKEKEKKRGVVSRVGYGRGDTVGYDKGLKKHEECGRVD